MAEGVVLDPDAGAEAALEETPQETPSVFAVTNRYLVGGAEVSPPAEDGSRVVRLHSASGQAVIECNLAPQLAAFIAEKLVAIEVIEEDDADAS
jgi:hypothetical protein